MTTLSIICSELDRKVDRARHSMGLDAQFDAGEFSEPIHSRRLIAEVSAYVRDQGYIHTQVLINELHMRVSHKWLWCQEWYHVLHDARDFEDELTNARLRYTNRPLIKKAVEARHRKEEWLQ